MQFEQMTGIETVGKQLLHWHYRNFMILKWNDMSDVHHIFQMCSGITYG